MSVSVYQWGCRVWLLLCGWQNLGRRRRKTSVLCFRSWSRPLVLPVCRIIRWRAGVVSLHQKYPCLLWLLCQGTAPFGLLRCQWFCCKIQSAEVASCVRIVSSVSLFDEWCIYYWKYFPQFVGSLSVERCEVMLRTYVVLLWIQQKTKSLTFRGWVLAFPS